MNQVATINSQADPSDRQIPLPHFLVIGGMKCATTTLHQDLEKHPDIYCGRKELNALTLGEGVHADSRAVYANNFKDASATLLGDVSTTYSQIPLHQAVPEHALELMGSDLKIIYVVRNPIQRTISHHQHMMNWSGAGRMGPDINQEIHKHPELIEFSCYTKQLRPWLDSFGKDQIHVMKFEDYVGNRQSALDQVFGFLGVRRQIINFEEAGLNRGHDRRVAGKWISKLYQTKLFQRIIKPLSPDFIRGPLRKLLLRKSKLQTIQPTPETIEYIFANVWEDAAELQKLTGCSEPLWDLDATKLKYASEEGKA